MTSVLRLWFWEASKLAFVALGMFYAVYVLVTYSNSGPNYRPSLDPDDPIHSFERILLWLGIKIIAAAVTVGRKVFDYLSEPSADVGHWVIGKSPLLERLIVRNRPR